MKNVELFVCSSNGVDEFVSGEGWKDYDYEKVDVDSKVIKEYYVCDDIIKIVVENDYKELEVLDEIEKIDRVVFGF